MKSKQLNELKNIDAKELQTMVVAKKLELFTITGKIYAGREKNLKKGKNLKRDIAQIMTVIRQKGNKVSK